jgi:hypothetical protein
MRIQSSLSRFRFGFVIMAVASLVLFATGCGKSNEQASDTATTPVETQDDTTAPTQDDTGIEQPDDNVMPDDTHVADNNVMLCSVADDDDYSMEITGVRYAANSDQTLIDASGDTVDFGLYFPGQAVGTFELAEDTEFQSATDPFISIIMGSDTYSTRFDGAATVIVSSYDTTIAGTIEAQIGRQSLDNPDNKPLTYAITCEFTTAMQPSPM